MPHKRISLLIGQWLESIAKALELPGADTLVKAHPLLCQSHPDVTLV
jgi:hypothetical protein